MQDYDAKCREIFGEEIGNPNPHFHIPFTRESEAGQRLLRHLWQEENRMVASLFQTIKDEEIPGVFVEFGVYEGKALLRMLEHCERLGLEPEVYGFDSFEGLPEPSPHDPPHWYKGKFVTTMDIVEKRLKPKKRRNLHLVKGWFNETLARSDIQRDLADIAYARIDCDLYESTKEVLQFLDGRLSNGAIMTFDDWIHHKDQGETKAFFEWYEQIKDKYRFEFLYTIAQGISHFRVWHR